MKGQEQVQCKFYDELAQILVPQLDEIPGEPEDDENDLPANSHLDIGKIFSNNCGVFTFFPFPTPHQS